ncbi:uncharacterized protein DUSP22AL isoform X11 [Gallus gallus]|uniref:uncharacterized protein DUSP22AL isoform X11 n=1 Tax=Gallus gallus TaxID=9031 RepID=UPI001AE637DE|nr:uncharacterized protein DUSP22AL isoform X11 [Gallus gallus]
MEVWERCSAAHLVSLLQGGGGGLIPGAAHHLCHAVFWGRAMPTESESPEWKPEPLILISSSPALQQLLSPLPDDTEPVTLDTESLPRSSPWGEESHGEWNEQDSEDRDSLRRHGVTHILSVHNRAKPVLERFHEGKQEQLWAAVLQGDGWRWGNPWCTVLGCVSSVC